MAAWDAALLLLCVWVAQAELHPLAPPTQSLLNELAVVLTQLTQRARSLLIVDVGKPDEISQILHAAAHGLQVAVSRAENATTSLGSCVGVVSAPSWTALSFWLKRQPAPFTSPSGVAHWVMYAPEALTYEQKHSLFAKSQNILFDRGTGILQWDQKSTFMLSVQYENVIIERPAIHGWPSEPAIGRKKRFYIAPERLQNLMTGTEAFRGSNKHPFLMELAVGLRWHGKFVPNVTEENFLKEGADVLLSPWGAAASPRLEVIREPLNELVVLAAAPRPRPAPLVALVRRALARGACACLAAVVACAWGARVLWGRGLVRRSVAGGVTLLGAMVLAGVVHSLLARVLGGRSRGGLVPSPAAFLAADPAIRDVLAAATDERARRLAERVLPSTAGGREVDGWRMAGDCGWLVPIEMVDWLKDQSAVLLWAVRAPAFALAARRGSPWAAEAARAGRRLGESGLLGSAHRVQPLLRRLRPAPRDTAPLRGPDLAAPVYMLAAAAALGLLALVGELLVRRGLERQRVAGSKRKRSVTSTVLKRWRMLSVANLRAE